MNRAVVLETYEPIPEELKKVFSNNGIDIVQTSSVNDFREDADFLLEYSSELSPEDISGFISRAQGRPLIIGITDRIIIREICAEDYNSICRLYESCKDAFSGSFYTTFVESSVSLQEYIRFHYPIFGYGLWILALKTNPSETIGLAGLYTVSSTNLASYALFPEYRNKGYCQEAMTFIPHYVRDRLGITDISAEIASDNVTSRHIADKLGIKIL